MATSPGPTTTGNKDSGVRDAIKAPKLTITVGTFEDNTNYVGPPEDSGEVFIDIMTHNRYEGDTHRYMLGCSSPDGFQGASVAFVQLCAPTLLWICDWTVCQANTDDPKIPDPFSVGEQWVLLDLHLEPAMLGLSPDGISVIRRISGTYVFGHKNPGNFSSYTNSPFTIAQWPRPTWLADTFNRTILASSLESQLITQNLAILRSLPAGGQGGNQGVNPNVNPADLVRKLP
jgi:hypothetical protein